MTELICLSNTVKNLAELKQLVSSYIQHFQNVVYGPHYFEIKLHFPKCLTLNTEEVMQQHY